MHHAEADRIALIDLMHHKKSMLCGTCNVVAIGAKSMSCLRENCPGKITDND
jgi:hypothetical protein